MYTLPLRMKIAIHYHHFEKSIRRVALLYGVSKSTVSRWVNADIRGHLGTISRPKIKRPMRLGNKIDKEDLDVVIVTSLENDPYMSGKDLVRVVINKLGKQLSTSTIQRARKRLGFSRKVATRSHQHQSAPSDHPLFRLDDAYDGNMIAVDECGFVSTDRPTRGWCKRSKRLPKPPPKRRTRHSLLLAIGRQGVASYKITKGTFDGHKYAEFLKTLPGAQGYSRITPRFTKQR